jgi:alkyl sulfatase BDS1-like metallo-beta-lactamase superfamily hydrolase
VLDRIFDEMAARLRADRAHGINAEVRWRIDVRGERHEYVLRIADGEGQIVRTPTDPAVTFTMDLATFARLATGQADPVRLLLTRRLRVSGNLLLARRIPTLFAMPKPDRQGR